MRDLLDIFERKIFKGNKLLIIPILMSLSFGLMVEQPDVVYANHQLDICESDKCRARVLRIQECDNLYMKKTDILDCATRTTLTASYEGIYNQLDSLYLLMNTELLEETVWKAETLTLLKKHEGLRFEAYCDNLIYKGGKYIRYCPTGTERHSIGYGNISYRGEVINEEEADRRVLDFLENNVFHLIEGNICYSDNQKIAISDFIYNSGRYTQHNVTGIYFIHYVETCNKEVIKGFLNPANYESKGLKKRRGMEYSLFLK